MVLAGFGSSWLAGSIFKKPRLSTTQTTAQNNGCRHLFLAVVLFSLFLLPHFVPQAIIIKMLKYN